MGLTATVLDALDRRLVAADPAPVAIALSGGGDSLALLHLAADWASRRGRPLIAFTVDHGLNPESVDWTTAAGEAAKALGVPWRALTWTGPKPQAGLPAAARRARHALLAGGAREAGARVLLVGHTLDDEIEAERMRVHDVPALPHLKDWGPSPAWPEGRCVFLLRPLLGVRREVLREFLRGRGACWIEDPANSDPRFARARARLLESEDADRAPATAADEAPALDAVSATADGVIRLRRGALGGRALAAAALSASGTDRPPRGEALARLLAKLRGEGPVRATLAGARIVADGDGLLIGREAGRQGLPALRLDRAAPVVWDGRFEILAEDEGLAIVPLAGRLSSLSRKERAALAAVPSWQRGSLPAILRRDGAVVLPRPWGEGPGQARFLGDARLAAACGLIGREEMIRGCDPG